MGKTELEKKISELGEKKTAARMAEESTGTPDG